VPRPRWFFALLLPAVAAGLLLSACGGSSSSAASATTSTTAPATATPGTTTPGTTTPATTAPASGSGRAGFAAFESCLESHGLPADALGFGRGGGRAGFGPGSTGSSGSTTRPSVTLPKGVTESQFAAAMKACAADRPAFGGGFGGGFSGGFGSSAQAKAYEACLTEHGAKLPTRSTTSTSTPSSTTAGSRPFDNATFQKAAKACAALRPKFTPPTSSTTVAS
jgi:hypothetical protein